MAGSIRRPRLAQVPAREPRPEPRADGARLRRHLLLTPVRPGDPARGDDGRARLAVRQGKALYAGISSYSAQRTAEAAEILRGLGTPLLIHQPSYSMFNRWIDMSCSGCSGGRNRMHRVLPARPGPAHRQVPRRNPGVLAGPQQRHFSERLLTEDNLEQVRALNEVAQRRGQSLAQLALAWVLRDPRITSALIGVSSVEQLENNVAALDHRDFDPKSLRKSTATPRTASQHLGAFRARRSVAERVSYTEAPCSPGTAGERSSCTPARGERADALTRLDSRRRRDRGAGASRSRARSGPSWSTRRTSASRRHWPAHRAGLSRLPARGRAAPRSPR